MVELGRTSCLAGAHWSGSGLSLAEVPFSGKFLLRGRLGEGDQERLEGVLGCPLPSHVGPASGIDPAVALLSPGRWLVLCAAGSSTGLAERLASAVEGMALAQSDIGDGLAEILIEGPAAAELLASATPLDLRLSHLPVNTLAQTQFARISCMIWRKQGERFVLLVDSSCSAYAWHWLERHAPMVIALRAATKRPAGDSVVD